MLARSASILGGVAVAILMIGSTGANAQNMTLNNNGTQQNQTTSNSTNNNNTTKSPLAKALINLLTSKPFVKYAQDKVGLRLGFRTTTWNDTSKIYNLCFIHGTPLEKVLDRIITFGNQRIHADINAHNVTQSKLTSMQKFIADRESKFCR